MDRKLPDTDRKAERKAAERQTGTLILIAGPSGSGKDTLIEAAKKHFGENGPIWFPNRLITRTDTSGEDHTPVTISEFQTLLDEDKLFLHWEAHGLQYGVSSETLDQLKSGKTVILNISRKLIEEARAKWPNTRLVQISVDDEVLLQRLKNRGRESEQSILNRFARRTEKPAINADHTIDNSGPPETAINEFIHIVSTYL